MSIKDFRKAKLAWAGPSIFAIALATPAAAQDASTPNSENEHATPAQTESEVVGLNDIIVTAQRRSESLQKTPLTVTALTGDTLTARQITGVEDLVRISPGVVNSQQNGINRIFVRGIGLSSIAVGADPSVAFHVNGVYVGRPSAQLNSFFDISRIEVVRGPQGTLYGRNATGGSVNLITNQPTTDIEGYFNASYGNYNAYTFDGAVSGPLDDGGTVLARLAFKTANRDGYIRNTFLNTDMENQNQKSVRGIVEIRPSYSFWARLEGEYSRERDNNYATVTFGPYPGRVLRGTIPGVPLYFDDRHKVALSSDNLNQRDVYSITGTMHWDLSDAWSLQSITGWRKLRRVGNYDSDGSPQALGDFNGLERSRQVSQELQLSYESDNLKAVLGGFYYHEKVSVDNRVSFANIFGPGSLYRVLGSMDIDAYAGFGQVTYSVTPRLRLTGGLRYSSERRSTEGVFQGVPFPPPVPLKDAKTWNSLTPKVGVDFDVTPDIMAYASFTRGFKSGTFNVGQNNPAIDPEKVSAYEAGVKANLFNRALELTAAAFYYDYTDLQVNKIIGIATVTVNAASAKNKGIEASARAKLGQYVVLNGDLTYLDATFSNFSSINPLNTAAGEQDLSGNFLPGAARWTANAGADVILPLQIPGQITLRGDMNYISRRYFTEFNDPIISQAGVTRFNASLRYASDDEHWNLSVWVKNLTDENVAANKLPGVGLFGFPILGSWEAPRTYGVTAGVRF